LIVKKFANCCLIDARNTQTAMMLRVYSGLNVVANRSGSFATTGHGTGVRIRKRQLSVRLLLRKRPSEAALDANRD
jgi:hypothetical protein